MKFSAACLAIFLASSNAANLRAVTDNSAKSDNQDNVKELIEQYLEGSCTGPYSTGGGSPASVSYVCSNDLVTAVYTETGIPDVISRSIYVCPNGGHDDECKTLSLTSSHPTEAEFDDKASRVIDLEVNQLQETLANLQDHVAAEQLAVQMVNLFAAKGDCMSTITPLGRIFACSKGDIEVAYVKEGDFPGVVTQSLQVCKLSADEAESCKYFTVTGDKKALYEDLKDYIY